MPSVTVLMPIYNAMPFLPSALESVLRQTLRDITVLIIDDGSTDDSATYLSQINDPRVCIVSLNHQGSGLAANYGINACKTEFIARMDADDISLPNRLESQLNFMRANKSIAAVGTQFKYIGSRGEAPSPSLPLQHDEIRAYLLRGQLSLIQASMMIRTSVLHAIRGYRIKGVGEDWDLFLRLSEVGRLANLPETFYLWRMHQANSDINGLMQKKIGVDYGCYCAQLRRKGESEITFEEYHRRATRKSFQKLTLYLDVFAFAQYRKALAEIGDGHTAIGYSRLAFSAICSPSRTVTRIGRMLHAIN